MKKDVVSIKVLVAEMLNFGVEPGRTVISVKPELSVLYFAYTGAEDRTNARIAIVNYLQSMYQATEVALTSSQYAKSRFKYLATFNTPCAIDPSDYKVEKVDLSKF